MAKKKPATETRVAPTTQENGAKPKPAAKPAGWSDEQIGDAAGKIWHALAAGPQTVASLKKAIDAPGDLVPAALGWLAREGKLSFDNNGRSVTVSLR